MTAWHIPWLSWAVAYLAVHFFLYSIVLRRLPIFSQERLIFLYHVVPAGCVACLVLAALAGGRTGPAVASGVAVLGLQGIYSLSFLELWSLAEGGYSLSVLRHVDAAQRDGRCLEPSRLREIGAAKKESRIRSLERLGLVRRQRDRLALTGLGRAAAGALAAITWVAHPREA